MWYVTGTTLFHKRCKQMIDQFAKPWNKATERKTYLDTFSLEQWKSLSTEDNQSIQ